MDKVELSLCIETNSSPQQVQQIATAVLRELHRIAFCDERNVTAALIQCYLNFGKEACYHLGGLLEEQRINCNSGLPWSETLMRMDGDWHEFKPLLEQWLDGRTETRILLDQSQREDGDQM